MRLRTKNQLSKEVLLLLGGLILWFGRGEVKAQTDHQLWMNMAITAPLTEKFSVGGDVAFSLRYIYIYIYIYICACV